MRRILCFGDSNTYGYSPVDGSRYGDDIRWPGVLNGLLGDRFEVINEGKNGRTVAFDDPYNEGCNGMNDIVPSMENNEPLDLIIIMLGTNDLKVYFDATPQMIADNLKEMCELIRQKSDAKILLASPMLLGDQIEFSPLHLEFGRMQVDYSFELAPQIEKVAKEVGADFIDLAIVAMSSDVDCLHLMPEEHAKIAQAMQKKVLDVFKEELAQEEKEAEEARQQEELRRIQEEEARQREEEEARKKAEEEARQKAEEEARAQAEAEEAAKRKEEEEARQREEEEARKKAEEEAQLSVEEEARLKAEAIFKAAEEEVAREESMQADAAERADDLDENIDDVILDMPKTEEKKEAASGLLGSFVRAGAESAMAEEKAEPLESVLAEVKVASTGKSEKEKMLSGKLYRCDAALKAEMTAARELTTAYNQTTDEQQSKRRDILASLLGRVGQAPYIEPPFRCDYGSNITIGDNFYANFDCIMLDTAQIKIGNNVFFGPKVNIYTACHPIYAPVRNELFEYSKEVTIGDDVWIGGNVTINPGVHIGNNVVIGSGAVVTGDIPDGVVAAGNPCRIIRKISDSDRQYWEEKKAEQE